MICPNCGAQNPDYSFYCGMCAAELKGGSTNNAQVAGHSEVTNAFDREKWAFRWRFAGAVELILGLLGLVIYGYDGTMYYLITGLVMVAFGAISLLAPLFEVE